MANLREALRVLQSELAEANAEVQRLQAEYQAAVQRANRRRQATEAIEEILKENTVGGHTLTALGAGSGGGIGVLGATVPVTDSEGNGIPASGATLKHGTVRTTRRHTRGDILNVMRENPRPAWSKLDLAREFERRGWTSHMSQPVAAIAHAADRLVDDNLLVRPQRGHYALPEDVADALYDGRAGTNGHQGADTQPR